MGLLFKDISYAQGQYNMDADPDPAVAMKASGFYTSSKIPYLDTQLVRNYADAKRLGKVPILYHFAGGADPVTEANYFFQALSPLEVGDIPALDFEIDTPDNITWVRIFTQHIHDLTGCWPWVYIDRSRREAGDWSSVFSNCAEWIAAPDVSFDASIPGVGMYMAQQGPIINGVDTDEYFGTLESLAKYGYGYTTQVTLQTPPVVPPPAPVVPPVAAAPARIVVESPPPVEPTPPPEPEIPVPPTEVQAAPRPVAQEPLKPEEPLTPVQESAAKTIVMEPIIDTPAQSWISKLIKWLRSFFGLKG